MRNQNAYLISSIATTQKFVRRFQWYSQFEISHREQEPIWNY